MKTVTYLKKDLSKRSGRFVSVREALNDKECDSHVTKNYVYLVRRVDEIPATMPVPVINIVKNIDTVAQAERFRFRVKGVVYMRKQRFIYRVDYAHSLSVRIEWKTHVLSS